LQACANTSGALGRQGYAELDVVSACDQLSERLSPLLQRPLAEIVGIEAEKVEGDECGLLAARPGAQGGEVGMSVRAKYDRLAVDQGVVDGQGAHSLHDSWKSASEVRSVSGPQGDAIGVLAGQEPVAVMLHLVQPARSGGRVADEGWPTGLDEAGRWVAPGGNTPQHIAHVGGGLVVGDPQKQKARLDGSRPGLASEAARLSPATSAPGVYAIAMPCGRGQDVLMLSDVLQRLSLPYTALHRS